MKLTSACEKEAWFEFGFKFLAYMYLANIKELFAV